MAAILVIDDDQVTRSALRVLLEGVGHQVRDAEDGAVGLQLLRQQLADLVFCDLFMPGQEGLETIRILRDEMPAVKVVAMSGGAFNGKLDLLDVAVKLGAAGKLSKPFEAEDALAAVEAILQSEWKK